MTDNSKKVSELPTANVIASTDRVVYLKDPSGVPSVRTITVNNFISNVASYIVTLAAANAQPAAAAAYANAVQYTNAVLSGNLAPYVSNTQLQANLTNYQTVAGMATTVINLTANNVAYVGNTLAAEVASHTELQNNLANYATLTYVDSAISSGLKSITLVEATSYTANSSDEVILCDPNAAGNNIMVTLPTPSTNGKIYTIKNINAGGYYVYVQSSNSSATIEVHGSGSLQSNVSVGNTNGNTVTWVWGAGAYRVLNYG